MDSLHFILPCHVIVKKHYFIDCFPRNIIRQHRTMFEPSTIQTESNGAFYLKNKKKIYNDIIINENTDVVAIKIVIILVWDGGTAAETSQLLKPPASI